MQNDASNCECKFDILTSETGQFTTVKTIVNVHRFVNEYLSVLGLRDDPDCDRCDGGVEFAMHLRT